MIKIRKKKWDLWAFTFAIFFLFYADNAIPKQCFAFTPVPPDKNEYETNGQVQKAEVVFDSKRNLITVAAYNVRLGTLLTDISSKINIPIYLWGSAETPVSVRISNLPVEEAIRRLTRGISHAVIYKRNDAGTILYTPASFFIYVGSPGSSALFGEEAATISEPASVNFVPETKDPADALEISSDNFFTDGEEPADALETLKEEAFAGNEEALSHIADLAIHDEKNETRVASIEFLGSLGQERAMDTLLQTVADSEARVRVTSLQAIGQYGGERVLNALRAALQDPDIEVRKAAMLVLDEADNGEREEYDSSQGGN